MFVLFEILDDRMGDLIADPLDLFQLFDAHLRQLFDVACVLGKQFGDPLSNVLDAERHDEALQGDMTRFVDTFEEIVESIFP